MKAGILQKQQLRHSHPYSFHLHHALRLCPFAGLALQARQRRKQRNYRVRPQQAEPDTSDEHPVPHSLPTAEQKEPTAQELAQGVKDIVAAFPSIHLHVAEMTLKVGILHSISIIWRMTPEKVAQHILVSRSCSLQRILLDHGNRMVGRLLSHLVATNIHMHGLAHRELFISTRDFRAVMARVLESKVRFVLLTPLFASSA